MDSLTVIERRNKIIEMLNESGRVNATKLSKHFGVSSVAIRTDLAKLEEQGLLTRVHGGAITSYKSYYDMSLLQRSNTNALEKRNIAKAIAEMIHENDTLIMNAGTTPIFVMRELYEKKVTIVTNSIALALEGAKNINFKIILLGGYIDAEYQFTYGISALRELSHYTADTLILSVDGIDAKKGFTTFYHEEAEICRKMIGSANQTIIAADYSKLGRVAFAEVAPISSADKIVTNKKNIAPSFFEELKKKNVEIITVP